MRLWSIQGHSAPAALAVLFSGLLDALTLGSQQVRLYSLRELALSALPAAVSLLVYKSNLRRSAEN